MMRIGKRINVLLKCAGAEEEPYFKDIGKYLQSYVEKIPPVPVSETISVIKKYIYDVAKSVNKTADVDKFEPFETVEEIRVVLEIVKSMLSDFIRDNIEYETSTYKAIVNDIKKARDGIKYIDKLLS